MTSDLLLSINVCDLAPYPLHFQVLPPGRAPSLDNVRQVPFEAAVIPADDPETVAAQIRLLVQRRAEGFPAIVDMPCQRIRTTMHMLAGIEVRILLAMRAGAGKLANRPWAGLTSAHPMRDGGRSFRVQCNPVD